ncbi:MAG: FAD-dependent oxidoreductase [Alphaproteobacteria bacterium]|uniref:FAD-dependent oxidoreductase n=1 Tax=Candidatus Nitrobium versatile TaxID=2884831 RepID=A0A953M156_9BACT|nr:FAD-dependent oxidoreductase [Candidatus Nitrobium versatile]
MKTAKRKEQILILGAGAAGLSAADAIRTASPDTPITVVSGEKGRPYARMALPYYISGKIPREGIMTRGEKELTRQGITYRAGDPAAGIDIDRRRVVLASNRKLSFDKLLIATGSVPEYPEMLAGAQAPGVSHLWTLKDAQQIKRLAREGSSVAVWGAGFVSFMAAKALAGHGRKVHLICRADRILRRVLDEEAAGLVDLTLCEKDVFCLKNTNVEKVEILKGGKKRVALNDGSELIVDLFIIALGTKPNVSFLEGTPLAGKKGIEVDEYLETSIPGIYAAGDVAVVSDCVTGERITPALWSTAVMEGRGAGLNMAGARRRCDLALLMNVVDFGGYSAISIGHPLTKDAGAEVFQFTSKRDRSYRRFVFKENRLIGAIIVGKCFDAGFFPMLIRRRVELTRDQKDAMLRQPWDMVSLLMSLPSLMQAKDLV